MPTQRHARQVRHEPAYKQAFVEMALPSIRETSAKYGVPVSVMLAQAVTESGWGRKVKSNAYFGIKGKALDGTSVQIATHEYDSTGKVAKTDEFRDYKSFAEAADDYGRLFNTNPKLKHALAFRNDPERFIDEIVRAHYATDPNYKKTLMDVIRDDHFAQYDK